jgi:hypothetical protein
MASPFGPPALAGGNGNPPILAIRVIRDKPECDHRQNQEPWKIRDVDLTSLPYRDNRPLKAVSWQR